MLRFIFHFLFTKCHSVHHHMTERSICTCPHLYFHWEYFKYTWMNHLARKDNWKKFTQSFYLVTKLNFPFPNYSCSNISANSSEIYTLGIQRLRLYLFLPVHLILKTGWLIIATRKKNRYTWLCTTEQKVKGLFIFCKTVTLLLLYLIFLPGY